MGNNTTVSFAKRYVISPEDYFDVTITELPFSVRVINRFINNNIKTVADLLQLSPEDLMELKGFGANCLKEVNDFLSGLQTCADTISFSTQKVDKYIPDLFRQNKDCIALGDFSFADSIAITESELEMLRLYKEAYENLGDELVLQCFSSPERIYPLIGMFNNFCAKTKYHIELWHLMEAIPYSRKINQALGYINAYTLDEDDRSMLLSFCSSKQASLQSMINANDLGNDMMKYMLLKKFLKWCTFDINKEKEQLLQKVYERPRIQTVVKMRAQKQTLEQIGNLLDVTRERVRQIEAKARRSFAYWQSRVRIVSKIAAERNGDSVITPEEIEDYCGANVEELLFLLRGCQSSSYTYDARLDVFVVGDESLHDRVLSYIENLPDVININNLSNILKIAQEDDNLPEEMLGKAIIETYQLTGNIYHRNRLSLASIYTSILKEFYPNGINAYDEDEIKLFREHIKSAYGDIKLPTNDRALAARISCICILCGRGTYKLKEEKYMSDELAKRIYDYIVHSDNSIFLTNTLFNVFEDDLVEQGINNKYYLQGILHELYGDQFVFSRDYISKDGTLTSIYSSIVDFIKKSRYPVSKKQIHQAFPGITDIVLNFAISDPNVLNYFGEYLRACKLVISDSEKSYLNTLILNTVNDGYPHHVREFFDRVSQEKPELLTRNAALYPFPTYSILEYLFRNEYQFSRPYIAQNGIDIGRPGERLHDLIYSNDEFAISNISEFMKDNHFQIQSLLEYINTCNDVFLLADNSMMISIERTGITEEIAQSVEDAICAEITGTTPICQLTCCQLFPIIHVPWTDWLIYSVLNKWATKLSVATSFNQLRLATPLVAPVGKVDTNSFIDIRRDNTVSIRLVDDLDNIDDLLANIIDTNILAEDL